MAKDFDSYLKNVRGDAWSPEAREAAAKARQREPGYKMHNGYSVPEHKMAEFKKGIAERKEARFNSAMEKARIQQEKAAKKP